MAISPDRSLQRLLPKSTVHSPPLSILAKKEDPSRCGTNSFLLPPATCPATYYLQTPASPHEFEFIFHFVPASKMSIGGKGVGFLATIVVFTVLCTLALGLRWRAARLQGRRFQVDDGLLIFAWVRTQHFSTLFILFYFAPKKEALIVHTCMLTSLMYRSQSSPLRAPRYGQSPMGWVNLRLRSPRATG